MNIVSRTQWGARLPKRVARLKTPTPNLYLHHAAGSRLPGDDRLSDADLTRVQNIQNYHMDVRKWPDIAYQFLLDPDGFILEGVGGGFMGTHVAGQNSVSHGICAMGNYEVQPMDDDLLPGLVELVVYGFLQNWWPLGITGGHRDAPGAETKCPGRNLYGQIPLINRMIKETYLMGWQKPGDPVVNKDDIKAVHRWQGNKILTDKDIDYDENDPAHLDERHLLIGARIVSEVMKYQNQHGKNHP